MCSLYRLVPWRDAWSVVPADTRAKRRDAAHPSSGLIWVVGPFMGIGWDQFFHNADPKSALSISNTELDPADYGHGYGVGSLSDRFSCFYPNDI